jgi:hypothetical protein
MPEVQKQQGETADYVLSDRDVKKELAFRSFLNVEKDIEGKTCSFRSPSEI